MRSSIRLLDPLSDRVVCGVCHGTDGLSELHFTSGSATTVMLLCRACLIRLTHAATGRLVQLDRDRPGDNGG